MVRGQLSRVLRGAIAICCVLAGVTVVQLPGGVAAAAPVSGVGSVFVPSVGRLLDTRSGLGAPARPVGAGQVVSLQLPSGTVPAAATAVRLNVTAVSPTAATYITVYPEGVTRPVASNLNVPAGGLISNLVSVKVGATGRVDLYNNAGSVQLIADLVGYDTPDAGSTVAGQVFSAVPPARALDTRDGTGGHLGRVGPGGVVSLPVLKHDGVPALDVGSVVLNVTVVDPSAAGYVTVYPDGGARPATSNLNFTTHQTVPNLVIAQVGSDGNVDLYNNAGTVDLVADIAGYGTPTSPQGTTSGAGTDGTLFDPLAPTRILDTRDGTGTASAAPVGPDHAIAVAVAGHDGVPANATAVALNVTATGATATATTYVTVYPGGTTRPVASNLNVPTGATIANQVIVPIGPDGTVALYNHAGNVHLIADLAGYYTTGATSPWHTAQAPVPPGTPAGGFAVLAGVACASGGGCVASGYAGHDGAADQAILLTGSGDDWTAVNAPLPSDAWQPGSGTFQSRPVCPYTGTCLVLGTYQLTTGLTGHMLTQGYGTTWTSSTLPMPAGASLLTDPQLACNTTTCTAAALDRDAAGTTHVLLITGDPGTQASTWTPVEAPVPPDATGGTVLSAVAVGVGCGLTTCLVTATYRDAVGVPRPYLITGSGTTWTAAYAPLPDGDSAPDGRTSIYRMGQVFCGPAACVVTGTHQAGTDHHAVLLTSDGSTWTAAAIPQPPDIEFGEAPLVDSLVCPTADRCVGTASYPSTAGNHSDSTGFLLAGSNSTPWTTYPLTGPDGTQRPNGAFTLACPDTTCVIAGGYRDIWGVDQLAVGTGPLDTPGSWPSAKATPPPGAYEILDNPSALQVACASPSACVAVGTFWDGTDTAHGILLTGTANG